MLAYHIRLALLSMRRNPVLSLLMVIAIALGIGVSMTTLTVYYLMSSNPIPHRSDVLYAVQLDSWGPHRPFDADRPGDAPHQVTWRDAMALLESAPARRQAAMFETSLIVQPGDGSEAPFEITARATFRDFFAMFDVPFLFGQGWDAAADRDAGQVIVLTKAINERLFGGENSVGRRLSLNEKIFTVSGVIDDWAPTPRFYDPINGGFQEVRDVFIPMSLTPVMELNSIGSDWGWKSEDIESFDDWLNSESVWIQYWAELHGRAERAAYLDHLNAYVQEQKLLGRFERPLNNHIKSVMEWMEHNEVVADDSRVLVGLSFLFLVVCLLSTVALLLTKFFGKTAEVSLRRALGADRATILRQHLVEVGVIGIIGGITGLGLALGGLAAVKRLYRGYDNLVQLDGVLVATAMLIALIASLLAGLYPAWRTCRIMPAAQLKTQ